MNANTRYVVDLAKARKADLLALLGIPLLSLAMSKLASHGHLALAVFALALMSLVMCELCHVYAFLSCPCGARGGHQ
jgi:hypothetical protein